MRMRSVALAAVVFGFMVSMIAASVARGQESEGQPKKVFGYLDPKTGTFKPAVPMIHPDAATTPPTTGTVTLTITMKLATAFPAKSTIICGLGLNVLSENVNPTTFVVSVGEWLESASSAATISGSTASCKVTIPYAWVLPAASSATTNTMSATFNVAVSNTATTPGLLRESTQELIVGEAVPANGTTSSYTANVTL